MGLVFVRTPVTKPLGMEVTPKCGSTDEGLRRVMSLVQLHDNLECHSDHCVRFEKQLDYFRR